MLIVKHDIFTSEEERQVQLYTSLLGKSWFKRAILVVTHYDNPETDVDTYLDKNHSPAFKRLLNQFAKERIVVGTMQCDNMDDIDTLLLPRRQSLLRRIDATIATSPFAAADNAVRLRVRDWPTFLRYLVNFFVLSKDEDLQLRRLFEAFVRTGNYDRLYFCGYTDAICLEPVRGNNDDMFVTECMHVFHFDCIRVWLTDQSTCPVCRREITQFYTYTTERFGDEPQVLPTDKFDVSC
eukprot:m.72232 g.72232  ORF g.72232 m.72232 type:complete len:238 (+) comp20231_c0_seq1:325-1038(+)